MKINGSRDTEGFSLIEAALALLILGLIMVPLLMLYDIEQKDRIRGDNLGKFTRISNAINAFVVAENRYPLPADLFLAPGDAAHGLEYAGAAAPCVGWPTTDGVCLTAGADQLLIGAVPFEALGLNPEATYDYWGHKILYAVTQSQTVIYAAGGSGAVNVIGYDLGRNPVAFDTQQDMILISHGESAAGAYSRQGALVNACPAVGTSVDEENCNMDSVFFAHEDRRFLVPGVNRFVQSLSLANNNDFYDDYTFQQVSVPVDRWLQNNVDNSYALTFSERVGVGTESPLATLHVEGDVRAAALQADTVCNDDTTQGCFDPDTIGGAEPAMDCNQNTVPGRQAVVSIRFEAVNCTSPVDLGGSPLDGESFIFPAAFFDYTSPAADCASAGQLLSGFDAAGAPICVTP